MRIVSLLPAATEIVAALGLLDQLVGISHECDWPPEVNRLPRVTRCPIYQSGLSSREIDARVRETVAAGESLYRLDADLLRDLRPDLVLSQALCDVCAIGHGSVAALVATLPGPPRLLNLEPRRLADVCRNIDEVAVAAGVSNRAAALNAALHQRVAAVTTGLSLASTPSTLSTPSTPLAPATSPLPHSATSPLPHSPIRPRTLFLEWLDPPFAPGHWTPELIELAGGEPLLGVAGEPSRTLTWDEVMASQPDVIVVACCGYSAERARQDLPLAERQPGWADLPAVRNGRVHVLDGSHYFSRPGPRLVDSLELLATVIRG